ncbi:unnamed protein product, partial [Larinioides sclopetarius]
SILFGNPKIAPGDLFLAIYCQSCFSYPDYNGFSVQPSLYTIVQQWRGTPFFPHAVDRASV